VILKMEIDCLRNFHGVPPLVGLDRQHTFNGVYTILQKAYVGRVLAQEEDKPCALLGNAILADQISYD